jgi:hypothetical protein
MFKLRGSEAGISASDHLKLPVRLLSDSFCLFNFIVVVCLIYFDSVCANKTVLQVHQTTLCSLKFEYLRVYWNHNHILTTACTFVSCVSMFMLFHLLPASTPNFGKTLQLVLNAPCQCWIMMYPCRNSFFDIIMARLETC